MFLKKTAGLESAVLSGGTNRGFGGKRLYYVKIKTVDKRRMA